MWLYTARMSGLSIEDLKLMTIDQAEALMELKQFVDGIFSDKTEGNEDFWDL